MDTSEDELVAAIRRVLSGTAPGVLIGVGDDAAVLEQGSGELVLAADVLVEGVHFERVWTSARDLGAKAIAVNVSDLAAMGAGARAAVVSLGLSDAVDSGWVMELYGGMREACGEYALALVGGDLSRSREVVVAVTVTGEVAPGKAVLRSGARVGDRVLVTGSLGAAAGGLRIARAAPQDVEGVLGTDWARSLLRAQARPDARLGEGQTLAQMGATAMIDVSDGLAKDLSRLCLESGVGARMRLEAIPVAAELAGLASALTGVDALALALGGGEDYELLATLPPGSVEPARAALRDRFGVTLAEVGDIIEGAGLVAVEADGTERPLEPEGWDHFA